MACRLTSKVSCRLDACFQQSYFAACSDRNAVKRSKIARRGVLQMGLVVGLLSLKKEAEAKVLEDLAKPFIRPDLDLQEALIAVLDARSSLKEVQAVAASPKDSTDRTKINPRLPGIAKRLRSVGAAAPVLAATASGSDKEESVSSKYGGNAAREDAQIVDEVYAAVGAVLTLSGRGVRPELLKTESTEIPRAIDAISTLVDLVPKEELEKAQETRRKRFES